MAYLSFSLLLSGSVGTNFFFTWYFTYDGSRLTLALAAGGSVSGSVDVTWMEGGGECSAREVDLAGCELRLTGVEMAAADELFNDRLGEAFDVATAGLA